MRTTKKLLRFLYTLAITIATEREVSDLDSQVQTLSQHTAKTKGEKYKRKNY